MQWLGTFHSIGAKILRRHAELVGLKSDFSILDTDDQIRLLKQLIQAADIDEKRWPARQLAGHIDGWKNRGLTPDKVPAGEGAAYGNGQGAKLYAEYQERLKILNAADFGDLLLECLRLFQENPDVLAEYPERFRYMLVDEYQDTNVAQYLWLRLLAQAKARHRTSAASATTTSRSTAGAAPRSTTSCASRRTFPGAKVIRLERNYRSTRISWPPPRASSPTMRAGSARRCTPTSMTATRSRARRLGRRGGSPRDRRGHRATAAQGRIGSTRWRSWCAPRSRCANSRTGSSRSACPTG